jgi:hypothetical protein
LSSKNEELIDKYITRCQTDENINVEFPKPLEQLIADGNEQIIKFKYDIDLLFKDTMKDKIYYLECKYNDDHDRGKFVDINRKFMKKSRLSGSFLSMFSKSILFLLSKKIS